MTGAGRARLAGVLLACLAAAPAFAQVFLHFPPGELGDVRVTYQQGLDAERGGKYAEAAGLHLRAWNSAREQKGPDHPAAIEVQAAHAWALHNAGNAAAALPLQEDAAGRAARAFGAEHRTTLRLHGNLSSMHSRLGRLPEALRIAEETYRISREKLGDTHFVTLAVTYDLGELYRRMGRAAEGVPILAKGYQSAQLAYGQTGEMTEALQGELGASLVSAGRHREAVPLLEQRITAYQKSGRGKHPSMISSGTNLAIAYEGTGRFADALRLKREVIALATGALGERDTRTIGAINNLGASLQARGEYAEAELLFRRALELYAGTIGDLAPETMNALGNAAGNLANVGKLSESLGLYASYVDRVERIRAVPGLSERNRQAILSEHIPRYREYSRILARAGMAMEGFRLAELIKARTLVELVAQREAVNASITDPRERGEWDAVDREIASLNGRIAASRNAGERVVMEGQMNRLAAQADGLRKIFARKHPGFAALSESVLAAPQDAAALLAADTAFISFVMERDRAHVYILTATGLTVQQLPDWPLIARSLAVFWTAASQPNGLESLWQCCKAAVWELANGGLILAADKPPQGGRRIDSDTELSDLVGKRLIEPWYPLAAKYRRWIVSPDAALAFIPLDALRAGGRHVIESHDVQYVQSLSMLRMLREREIRYRELDSRKDVLAVGGAKYQRTKTRLGPNVVMEVEWPEVKLPRLGDPVRAADDAPNSVERMFAALNLKFLELPGTDSEARSVAALFGPGRSLVLTGDSATELRLEQLNHTGELADFRYLLFSVHGYLNLREPWLSAIVLGQLDKAPGTDGFLTAAELSRYRLRSDLTVLSACNTGIGQVVQGEGVMGLPYALFLAGNRNTVLTLWSIENESAQLFSKKLFEKLRAGAAHHVAVSETKRELMRDSRYRAPVYWAPYVLYGN